MTHFPEDFQKRQEEKLGSEWSKFTDSFVADIPVSININPLKKTVLDLPLDEVIPWCANGYYLKNRPSFTLDPLFHAGTYYVQEASSMAIFFIISKLKELKPIKTALDLCAAPGGKTLQIVNALDEDAVVVANEVIQSRYNILKESILKWGTSNVVATNSDSEHFGFLKHYFDLVLVDAPCSGEGLFRKDANAMKEWSTENVNLCAARQKRILSNSVSLLKEGGFLIYSTCTYNEQENDLNVKWLTKEYDLELIEIEFNQEWGITKTNCGWQFYPHKTKGEGFYVAVLQKQTGRFKAKKIKNKNQYWEKISKNEAPIVHEWSDANLDFYKSPDSLIKQKTSEVAALLPFLEANLKKFSAGRTIGTIIKNKLVPVHSLALSIHLKDVPKIVLDKQNALLFLRKANFEYDSNALGWHLVHYQNMGIGWVKVLKGRINNHYPKNMRILMR